MGRIAIACAPSGRTPPLIRRQRQLDASSDFVIKQRIEIGVRINVAPSTR